MARPRHVHERNKLRRCSIVAVLTTAAENMNIATDTRPADAAVEEMIVAMLTIVGATSGCAAVGSKLSSK
ncbi:hypothetical protein ACFX10_023411 [Malus domestica]